MSKAQANFLPQAVAEARAARQWYGVWSQLASTAFFTELDHEMEQIRETPSRWPPYLEGTRRYLLQRFPFFVVHLEHGDTVQILALAHGKRKPGYWKSR